MDSEKCSSLTLFDDGTCRCRLLAEKYAIDQMAGPSFENYPCKICQSQWTNGEPATISELPLSVVEMIVPPEIIDAKTHKAHQRHPDHCYHMEKTLNHQGCCSQRTWFCGLHGVVDLQRCRECGDFERDAV